VDSQAGYWSNFGEFESEDQFKKQYEELNNKAKTYEEKKVIWEKERKELEGLVEKEKSAQSMYIADDTLARLSVLKNTDKDKYDFYKKVVLTDMSPREIIAKSLQEQYPDLSKDKVDAYIDRKYGLNVPKPDEFDGDDEIANYNTDMEFKLMELRKDANSIQEKYKQEFEKIELPHKRPLSNEELIIKKANAEKAWSPYISEFTKGVGKLSVNINSDDGEIPIVAELTSTQVEKYSKMLSEMVKDNAIEFTEDNIRTVANSMKALIFNDQLSNLSNIVWEKASEHFNKYWEAKINGTSTGQYKNNAQDDNMTDVEAKLNKLIHGK
jgi:hypothetical protein